MIILVPIGSFKKKIEKWVRYKDFIIADATDRHDGALSEYGNKVEASEIAPTPTLTKIALDPDSQESKIKMRHFSVYVERWLDDESINLKMHWLVSQIVSNYKRVGEDMNIFVVMTKPLFFAYKDKIIDKFNEVYGGVELCTWITHKEDKEKIRAILTKEFPSEYYKTLKKGCKRVAKIFDIDTKPKEDF